MSDDGELRDHVEGLYKRRVAPAVKVGPDFGDGQCGEVTKVKRKDDDLDVIDPVNVRDGGEVSR